MKVVIKCTNILAMHSFHTKEPSQHRMCAIDTKYIVTISEHRLLCIP